MSTALPKYVHLNGRIVPTARAHVSVFDRGLLYGDGVFETLRAYAGRPFALPVHLARLQASAAFLGIALPRRPWRRDIAALLQRTGLAAVDAAIRITLTRGVGAPGLLPPVRARPTVLITAGALDPAIARRQRHGVTVTLLPFARHGFLSEHKVLDYLPAVLGKVMATRHDAFEGLYVDERGYVTEGTTSNLFVWQGHQLWTPPATAILPGLTRRLVIEVAVAAGIKVRERACSVKTLAGADEAFLTSSLSEVVPIVGIDGRPVGDGHVGVRTRQIAALYRQLVDQTPARHSPR